MAKDPDAMLSCKEVAGRASDLIDGELSGWHRLQIRLHLAMCRGCSRFIDQMRLTDRLAADIADADAGVQHEADDGRFAEVLALLRDEARRGR